VKALRPGKVLFGKRNDVPYVDPPFPLVCAVMEDLLNDLDAEWMARGGITLTKDRLSVAACSCGDPTCPAAEPVVSWRSLGYDYEAGYLIYARGWAWYALRALRWLGNSWFMERRVWIPFSALMLRLYLHGIIADPWHAPRTTPWRLRFNVPTRWRCRL